MTAHRSAAAAGLAAVLIAAGCGGGPEDGGAAEEPTGPAPVSGGAGLPDTPAVPDPADFVAGVDNPWLPLVPGTRWVYLSESEDGDTRIVTTVTNRTRTVAGVEAVVVHDVESTLGGRVLEDTLDWFAQDRDGNVWYLGEATTAYDGGSASTEGSWETGVDGAQAGIIMPGDPQVGDRYAQEHLAGEAEDRGEVLAVDARPAEVPARFGALVQTADTTPLEPGLVEHKFYARDVGVVREETVRGGREVVTLVSVRTPD